MPTPQFFQVGSNGIESFARANLGGPFNINPSGFDVNITLPFEQNNPAAARLDIVKELINNFDAVSAFSTPPGGLPFSPEQLFSIPEPKSPPLIGQPGAQNVQAVSDAASKARAKAQAASSAQRSKGNLAAAEIAAAKGKTAGSGQANIAAGINKEVQQNLDDLLAQITGTENQARQDVQNLGALNQGEADKFNVALLNLAAQNQRAFQTSFNDALQKAQQVLLGAEGNFSQQFGAIDAEQAQILTDIVDAFKNTSFGGPAPADPNNPQSGDFVAPDQSGFGVSKLEDMLASIERPSLASLSSQVDVIPPAFQDFNTIAPPNFGAADLNPFLAQFDTFKLDELDALGGALNQGGGDAGLGRGGRAQQNIPTVDPSAQFQNDDFLRNLLASLGVGGI